MIKEDNNGFINFPINSNDFDKSDGKTLIYLIAFDNVDLNGRYDLSNIKISDDTISIGDDISGTYDQNEDNLPANLTSCICIGWNNKNFAFRVINEPWLASYRDLTSEGKKLYYSIKKLHNNKDVRILTFRKI